MAVGITTGAAVVGTVGTGFAVAPVPGSLVSGTVAGVTIGTTGAVVVANDALWAVWVPLGQPIAATNANIAVADTPAEKIFAV